jgi:hypothetical protein
MISAAFESQNSASRDSFPISISQETLSNKDIVEIETGDTGDGDVSAVLKYIIATSSSNRSHKSPCISCTSLLY